MNAGAFTALVIVVTLAYAFGGGFVGSYLAGRVTDRQRTAIAILWPLALVLAAPAAIAWLGAVAAERLREPSSSTRDTSATTAVYVIGDSFAAETPRESVARVRVRLQGAA